MSDDLARIFNSDADKAKTLGLIWPDLHAALHGLTPPAARPQPCALAGAHSADSTAVGRMSINGTPACAGHLALSARPGGYPLQITDPRTQS